MFAVIGTEVVPAGPGVADGPRREQQDRHEEGEPQQRENQVTGHQDREEDKPDEQDGMAVPPPRAVHSCRSSCYSCRSPCFRQVIKKTVQVGAGLGVHGPADSLVELGLVQAPVAEVLGQAVGDRLALGVGNPEVLIGIGAGE